MKIGILTFHAAHNYGAILQCYALQTFLAANGHTVEVIDYRQTSLLEVYRVFSIRRFISISPMRMIKKIKRELFLLPYRKKRYDEFEKFINTYLRLTPVSTIFSSPFDVIIVGSDQVWNYQLTDEFDPYYWGNFSKPVSTRIVSYAASMQDNISQEAWGKMRSYLPNFSQISVREKSLAKKIKQELGIEVQNVVDPTLLLSSCEWSRLVRERMIDKEYVLLYEVNPSECAERIAKQISDDLGLRLISLSSLMEVNKEEMTMTASPISFLNLFYHASFVVASSFHGTVFSLQFSRPFLSVKNNDGKDSRVGDLLSSLGLSELFVSQYSPGLAHAIINRGCEWDLQTDELKRSIEYLTNAIRCQK